MPDKVYKYDKGDGTMVSRQRIHQLRNPEKMREIQKRYRDSHKVEMAARNRAWRQKFKDEHDGISYAQWRNGKRPNAEG